MDVQENPTIDQGLIVGACRPQRTELTLITLHADTGVFCWKERLSICAAELTTRQRVKGQDSYPLTGQPETFVNAFLPRDAMPSQDVRLSVHLSVRPSVTRRYSVEMAKVKHIINVFFLHRIATPF